MIMIIIIIIIIIIMMMIIIILIIIIIETRKYWVDVQRGIVSSHGERWCLDKNTVWRHLKPKPQLL